MIPHLPKIFSLCLPLQLAIAAGVILGISIWSAVIREFGSRRIK